MVVSKDFSITLSKESVLCSLSKDAECYISDELSKLAGRFITVYFTDDKKLIGTMADDIALFSLPGSPGGEVVKKMLSHVFYWIVAYINFNSKNHPVGTVQIASDGAYLAYLQNLQVLSGFRSGVKDAKGNSVGQVIVTKALEFLHSKKLMYVFEKSDEVKVRNWFCDNFGFKADANWTSLEINARHHP